MRFLPQLNEKQIELIQQQSHALWGDGSTLEDRIAKLKQLLAFGPEQLKMCGLEIDGKLVSSLKRYRLAYHTPTGLMPTIGLGAIFTPESERGKGYAGQLIKATLKEAADEGFSGAMLFSDIGAKYYEQFGFRAFPLNRAIVAANSETLPANLRLIPSTPQDIRKLLAFREQYRPQNNWTTFYDSKNWPLFCAWALDEPPILIEYRGTEIGYISVATGKEALGVPEICVPESFRPQVWSILKTIAHERKLTAIRGWLRSDQAPPEAAWTQLSEPVPMIAIFSEKFHVLSIEKFSVTTFDYF